MYSHKEWKQYVLKRERGTDMSGPDSISPNHLFPDELAVEIAVEGLTIVVANGEIGVGIHDDAVFVDFTNAVEVDDITAVDAHEPRRGQPLFEFLHAEQHHNGFLAFEMYLEVFAHAFHIAYIGNTDANHLIVGFEEKHIIVGHCRDGCRVLQLIAGLHLHGSAGSLAGRRA